MSALGGGLIGGLVGGAMSQVVTAPFVAGNNFLGSYFFGSGMLLGERQMYQRDWPRIKERLDKGTRFDVVLEEYMKENTQAVLNVAKDVMVATADAYVAFGIAQMQKIIKNVSDATGLPLDEILKLGQPPGVDNINTDDKFLPPLQTLTWQQVHDMSDNSLDHAINRIDQYDKATRTLIEQEAQRRNRHLPPPKPVKDKPPIDVLADDTWKLLIANIDLTGLPQIDQNNIRHTGKTGSITSFFNFVNSIWSSHKKYVDNVIKSDGSQNSPEFIRRNNIKFVYERIILQVNVWLNSHPELDKFYK